MTKVIFYTNVSDKFDWLARTAEKVLARKKTACILVNEIDRDEVFAKLWSFADISFIGISEDSRGDVGGELVREFLGDSKIEIFVLILKMRFLVTSAASNT